MSTARKSIAWICMISFLFAGCYTSAMIDPAAADNDKMYTDTIQIVITKDGTRYKFDTPPTISKNAIAGVADSIPVSIPLSDVSKVYVTKPNPTGTVFLVLAAGALVALIVVALSFKNAVDSIFH